MCLQRNKYEEPHSPYTEKFEDDGSNPNYCGSELRNHGYAPKASADQKPEWKRYKQYTRNDINQAIECVRNGMSALAAARQFKVPSRTLYDKVKKLGITAGRPMNRTIRRSPTSNNGSPAGFPFGVSGTRSPFSNNLDAQAHAQSMNDSENGSDVERDREQRDRKRDRERHPENHMPLSMSHPAAALLDPTFLAHALETRGDDIASRDTLAIALAAAAHSAVNGLSTSPGTHGAIRSPSPSVLMKFIRPSSPSKTENTPSENERYRGSDTICHSSEKFVEHEHTLESQSHAMHDSDVDSDGESERDERSREHERELELERERERERDRDRDREHAREQSNHMSTAISHLSIRHNHIDHIDSEDNNDVVEDLSMAKSEEDRSRATPPSPTISPTLHHQQLGVIVPPLTKVSSAGKDEILISVKHELTIDEN